MLQKTSEGMVGVHRLSETELYLLEVANRILTRLTEKHGAWCECDWCEARMLTDSQDPESRSQPYLLD